ncbi:MAG TPA: class III signal peptide-containing protein [archaeon]|nr:class III signal peptide-containing protein [archaeon]
MKFNKKGQGALEYLLLIGGAVLIAVIVIALLVGMGSQNSENSKTRNEEAMAATNIPIPSVINSVNCDDTNHFIVNWTAVNKAGNEYDLIINYTTTDTVSISATTNPIVSVDTTCSINDVVAIKTTNQNNAGADVSVLSATATVK